MKNHMNPESVLKGRLQFVVLLVLFFPVVLDALYSASANKTLGKQTIVSWGVMVAVFILCYVLVEVMDRQISFPVALLVNRLLLFEAVLFVPVLMIFRAVQNGPMANFYWWPFGISLISLMITPGVVFLLLLGNAVYLFMRAEFKNPRSAR